MISRVDSVIMQSPVGYLSILANEEGFWQKVREIVVRCK